MPSLHVHTVVTFNAAHPNQGIARFLDALDARRLPATHIGRIVHIFGVVDHGVSAEAATHWQHNILTRILALVAVDVAARTCSFIAPTPLPIVH